jgi:serine/threonine-protein kinase SRPK3
VHAIPDTAYLLRTSKGPEAPRAFPVTAFPIIDPTEQVEEEDLPGYAAEVYFPVKLGDVLHDRYQILAKLGYKLWSTTWLARDLRYVFLNPIRVHSEVTHR